MSQSDVLIIPPAAEPVSIGDLKALLRIPIADTSRDMTLKAFLIAAREDCENYTRIKLMTQTWLVRADNLPFESMEYNRNGFAQFRLPYPPFQSVQFFQYVDTFAVVQTLLRDTTYGAALNPPPYGYQLEPGGGTLPARITPRWATPWPTQIRVPANTLIQFRCGFGGPVTVTTAVGSAAIVTPGFTFNPDDAPQLAADTGTKISIPGAGVGGAALTTNIASVDGNGVATLATAATNAVPGAQAWLGHPIPEALKLSILFHAQFFHEQGGVVDANPPRVVEMLRSPYRNFVS